MPENRSDDRKVNRKSLLCILQVSSSFPLHPGDVSGVFIQRLADALSKKALLEVLTPCGKDELSSIASYPVRCFRYGFRSWQVLTHSPGGIPATLKRQPIFWLVVPILLSTMLFIVYKKSKKADIIHANWSFIGLVCGIAGRLRGCPVVTTLRGSDVSRLDRSAFARLTTGWTLKMSTHTVTVSETMRQSLLQHFPWSEAQLTHIPNGVDGSLLALPQPSKSPILRIASIGNLIRGKAVHELLLALEKIKSVTRFDLLIVGDGPERAQLAELSRRLGLANQVHFVGSVPPNRIHEILSAIDVFVLTSHSEGRPNVVIEAMAAARAIIATKLPGVSEIIRDGENGLLFAPGDTDHLAQHLLRLGTDMDIRQRLGQSARHFIVDNDLTWARSADRYLALFQQSTVVNN